MNNLNLLKECLLCLPLLPMVFVIPIFKACVNLIQNYIDWLDANKRYIYKNSALSVKLHEGWKWQERPIQCLILGCKLRYLQYAATSNTGIVFCSDSSKSLRRMVFKLFCLANNVQFYEIELPSCLNNKTGSPCQKRQKLLQRKLVHTLRYSNWKSVSVIAFGEDCITVLEYLGELGASTKLMCAVLVNPIPTPTHTHTVAPLHKFKRTITSERFFDDTGQNAACRISHFRNRSVSSPTSSMKKWISEQESSLNSSIDLSKSVGLPDTLDDISVPLLWICENNCTWTPSVDLFTETVHFVLMQNTSALTSLSSSVTFVKAVHQFLFSLKSLK